VGATSRLTDTAQARFTVTNRFVHITVLMWFILSSRRARTLRCAASLGDLAPSEPDH
jgi:hypothetical protein